MVGDGPDNCIAKAKAIGPEQGRKRPAEVAKQYREHGAGVGLNLEHLRYRCSLAEKEEHFHEAQTQPQLIS